MNEAALRLSCTADAAVAATHNPDAPVYERKVDEHGRAYATGKRKDAIARVWLKPGQAILIEGATKKREVQKKNRKEGKKASKSRDFTEYFARPVLQMVISSRSLPLVAIRSSTSSQRFPAAAFPARPVHCATAFPRR